MSIVILCMLCVCIHIYIYIYIIHTYIHVVYHLFTVDRNATLKLLVRSASTTSVSGSEGISFDVLCLSDFLSPPVSISSFRLFCSYMC